MRLEVAAVAVHRAERRGEAEGVRVAADRGAGRGAQDRLEVMVGQERRSARRAKRSITGPGPAARRPEEP